MINNKELRDKRIKGDFDNSYASPSNDLIGLICVIVAILAIILVIMCIMPLKRANASQVNVGQISVDIYAGYTLDQWADAIYKTENSHNHPYGVLKHYKHTTARQACINSVKSSYKRWVKAGRQSDFIVWLGNTYSPPAINPNWVRLTRYFLIKGKPNE